MATALEPCPFCHGTHLHLAHSGLDFSVVCESCKSKGPHQNTMDQAIDRWNRTSRHAEMALTENVPFSDQLQPLARCTAARG